MQGSDVLFLYAPALIVNPSMTKQRAMLIALLWCNYREVAEKGLEYNQDIPHTLKVAFMAAVFGRHVSKDELSKWMKLGDIIDPTPKGLGQNEAKAPLAAGTKEN
jgi:hypothetical protein